MYKEYIVNNMCRSDAEEISAELLYGKSMIDEIERIYRIPNSTATLQHPVHYILSSDSIIERRLLLLMIYLNFLDDNLTY